MIDKRLETLALLGRPSIVTLVINLHISRERILFTIPHLHAEMCAKGCSANALP